MSKLPSFFETRVQKVESNGRPRTKEHIPGNWATIIFIPINLTEEVEKQVLSSLNFDNFKLQPIDPIIKNYKYHLSLTRTLYLKEYQRELFHSKVQEAFKKILSEFPLPETIESEKVSIYLNDEKSRTFVAIDLKRNDTLLKYIEVIDQVLIQFGLPRYYSDPKLHFSILWGQGNQSFEGENKKIEIKVELTQILIKCGNKITRII